MRNGHEEYAGNFATACRSFSEQAWCAALRIWFTIDSAAASRILPCCWRSRTSTRVSSSRKAWALSPAAVVMQQ